MIFTVKFCDLSKVQLPNNLGAGPGTGGSRNFVLLIKMELFSQIFRKDNLEKPIFPILFYAELTIKINENFQRF